MYYLFIIMENEKIERFICFVGNNEIKKYFLWVNLVIYIKILK